MVTDCTRCPTCGAPVDLTARSCPYCGVPYPKPRKTAQAVAAVVTPNEETRLISSADHDLINELVKQLEFGAITPNQARARMGLPPV